MMDVARSKTRVLVVPAEHLDRLGRFQGFCPDAERYLPELFATGVPSFRPRGEVEDDPSLKQIIPYVVLRCNDAVFCYTRGGTQGEGRLHHLRSIGIGGHVEEEDADGERTLDAYDRAMRRELAEEVNVDSPGAMRLAGLINDDSNPVGAVHLGVVHVFDLDRPDVSAREDGLVEAGFIDRGRLPALRDQFETWSRFCIDALLTP